MIRWPVALMIGLAIAGPLASGAPAVAANFVRVDDTPLKLDASKGALIRLDRPAATVFVADPEIADVQIKSPKLIYVFAKTPGETTLYAVDRNERVLLGQRITVSHNLTRLEDSIKQLLPNSDIKVASVDGALLLTGQVDTVVEAEDARRMATRLVEDENKDIINRISVTGSNQIQLRVRVAEVSKDLLKRFGINWESIVNSGNFLFGLATGRDAVVNGVFPRLEGVGSVVGAFNDGSSDINAVLDALTQEGMASILAEPNLTAVSGERAEFLAGGEFPIIVADENKTTVTFKPFGITLEMLPTIVGRNRINLHVVPIVSELSTAGSVVLGGFSVPSLTTRRVRTTVELGSGQSFAIAGLLKNTTNQSISKFPGLGDLPILGPLFRSERFQRNETELVVIVTPYIVRPVSERKLALPTDGLIPPNDVDRIVRGKDRRRNLERSGGAPRIGAGTRLAGPAGFVLN